MPEGGAKKAVKKTVCGFSDSTQRCNKRTTKNQDMCSINKRTNYCIKNQYTEAQNNARIFSGGAKKTTQAKPSCGMNKTGRCKRGVPTGKDLCTTNPKTNRCVKDKFTSALNYNRIFKSKK